ncbi:16957_t:CDS:1 [Funneliformis geosporum]|uniref:16759_t:CDS:1 n=1 Tax=Funneliformis geosporum TaxID=1117311 RepID=A0A9W4SCT3_9GLOM|nr:16957_t:CDS:1 [Funneliformis geosporum]CAI2163906.1 16759_t:CDS:1 [Funneliformis geosporum]
MSFLSNNHKIHYYEKGGDLFLKAENTIFLIHKTILSLSSEFFEDLFKLSTLLTNKDVRIIERTEKSSNNSFPTIEVNNETSESIERMLSFIYPNAFVEITWENVEDYLRISDKFIISKLTKSCSVFLLHHFQENVLLSFILADKYSFPKLFKESSKLVLDDLQKYRSDSTYDELSPRTKLKLMDSWFHYTNSLHKYFKIVSNRSIKQTEKVDKVKVTTFSDFLSSGFPDLFLKPSEFSKFYIDIDDKFSRMYRNPPSIGELFKNYEKLNTNEKKPAIENITKYIFIELENYSF